MNARNWMVRILSVVVLVVVFTLPSLSLAEQDMDGLKWHIETVDSKGGAYNSLALDAEGYPHISYLDCGNGELRYAYYDGINWHIQVVDSEGWVGIFNSLALDAEGYPHISYLDYTGNGDLRYAYHDGINWHIQVVDSEGWVGMFTSLALDAEGYPHISYTDYGNGDLKYAYSEEYYTFDYTCYLPLVLSR